MLAPKTLILTGLLLPSFVLAVTTQSCKASLHNFIVGREPGGYSVNKATLTILSAGACTRKDDTGPARDTGPKLSSESRPWTFMTASHVSTRRRKARHR